jgi:predicted O-methyltransferase YrrM
MLQLDPYHNLLSVNTLARVGKLASPRYVVRRIGVIRHEKAHPDWPWFAKEAVLRFEQMLQPSHHGFEWGSGNGTVWMAKRCAHLTSVEHHAGWAATVRDKITDSGLANVDYRVVDEADYVAQIDTIADESLDFVVVDGLFRETVLGRSLPKVRSGGFIVFDNVNWYLPSESRTPHSRSLRAGVKDPEMQAAADTLATWSCTWLTNGVNDTAIYVRP